MPGKKENLQHAGPGADPDLTFSYNELLEELKAEFNYPVREPGDVTAQEMADATGLTRNWCTELLAQKVKKGELVRLRVKDLQAGKLCFVYRRKK